jgi:hypothetical protein
MEPIDTSIRVQVALPAPLGARVRELAEAEHRPLRFQIEKLVIEALLARDKEGLPAGRANNAQKVAPVS